MKKRLLVGAVLLAGLATALIAEQKAGNQPADQNTGAQAQPTTPIQGAPQNAEEEAMANATPDQKFITCSAQGNLFAIEVGKLVAGKVSNERVKKLAQMMVDEHTKAQDRLKETAGKSNLKVPERLMSWQQSLLDFIAKAPADDLAAGYSFHVVGDHHTAILQTQYALTKIQDQGVKELAQRQLRDLRSHLQEANSVASSFTGGANISGEPVSPSGQKTGTENK